MGYLMEIILGGRTLDLPALKFEHCRVEGFLKELSFHNFRFSAVSPG